MKSFFTVLLLTLAAVAMPEAHAQMLPRAQTPQMIDRIVAVAQSDIVLQSELDQAVAQIRQQYANNPQQLPPTKILKQQVLQRLILMKLQVQRAQEQGVRVSNQDVQQATANVARQNHMTPTQLRQAIVQQGGSFAAFQKQLAEQIMVQRLRQGVAHNEVKVTDSEVNNLLNSPNYNAGKVHLKHIEIDVPRGASAEQIQEAAAKAHRVEQAIAGGMDFNAAAIRYSDAQDALQGGDLGWRRVDSIPPAFVSELGKLKPGQVSRPLRGASGFHILKLVGRKQPTRNVVTEYHARQIMIKPTELVSAQQARQKIDAIYKDIHSKHEKFAKLARQKSDDDTTANIGGDMGWFPLDAWGTAVAQHLQQLNDGEVSQPFKTKDGSWHIVERLATRRKDRTSEQQRDKARQAIGQRKAEQAYENYLREMRSSSYIHILVPALRPANGPGSGQS